MKRNTPLRPPIVYQLLPRLYGNAGGSNRPSGTLEENGCGKLADITLPRLKRLRQTGYTHVWYTGLLRHASQTAYPALGLEADDASIVKGKAGSPYAVKDYYDICPDLAVKPEERLKEFDALVERTHKAGLNVVMDFVPNHVARCYTGGKTPPGRRPLGADDDNSRAFSPCNNFYYIPTEPLHLDRIAPGSRYREFPAKATGNDRFDAWPDRTDWYETVKLNYGVDYTGGRTCHFNPVPDTWRKMTYILLYWAARGVDAFRCDMAEMVPAEFWHYATASVRKAFPATVFIAEVYNPALYRHFIHFGGFDYLYNKVGLYDTLRAIVRGEAPASAITGCWQQVDDIRDRMLNFLENHDEQRIASDFFASDPRRAIPAFMVAALLDRAALMVYAGQELGERGMESEGFSGCDGRTTIFDYWSVASLRKLLKGKGSFSRAERSLHDAYGKILAICASSEAITHGESFDLMYVNHGHRDTFNPDRQYAFLRKAGSEVLLIAVNFDGEERDAEIVIPRHAFDFLRLSPALRGTDLLTGNALSLSFAPDAPARLRLPAWGGVVCRICAQGD